MQELENPPENPCFGCGPEHPRGLRLRFYEAMSESGAKEVRATFVPQPDEIGWPGLFHHGLHFTVLYEASYWAALTLGGKLWISRGEITYHADRLPRVGKTHIVVARIDQTAADELLVRAESSDSSGRGCGSLASRWRPASRTAVERAGITLPPYLLSEMDL